MAFTRSPMEEYNKNNPLTILSKQVYDTILDTLQDYAKRFIIQMLIMGGVFLLLLGWCVFISIYEGQPNWKDFILAGLSLIGGVYYYFRSKAECRYYLVEHPAMREFDRMSKLEMSEIAELGVEDLLKCLHGEYELLGGLRASIGFLTRMGWVWAGIIGINLLIKVVEFFIGH